MAMQNITDPIEQVIQAEREWLEAHLRLDTSALERLMADEYTLVTPHGTLLGKQQVLEAFRSGQRSWQEAESDEYLIRIYGNAAVVFGRWRAKGINAGQYFDYASRYVSVWVYRDERWQMVSDQSTTIVDSA